MSRRTFNRPDVHTDWLAQVDIDGPFLAHPVLKDMWPDGVDRLGDTDDRLVRFRQAYAQWQRAFDHYVEHPKTPESKNAYDVVRRAWIDVILDDLAEWNDLRGDSDVTVRSPGEQITVAATGTLQGRDGDAAALLLVCEPTSSLRDAGLDGWAANDVDRVAMLLRKAQVDVGIVTDGQWWALVWAKEGKPTGSGMVNALTWAEEPLLRDAFFALINQRRFRAADVGQRLSRLFERSEIEAEEITKALGTQVRRSVELLVQAFSESRLAAAKVGGADPLTEKPDDIYQAAVTVMMRIVFLLFAEDRDMLPTEQLYWDSYAIKGLLDSLRTQAVAGEEQLDETYDAWHRLLAVSQALHGGVNYDEMRMPAYGGSLLDPERFPWLHAADGRGLRLKISDRVMLHVLDSVQTALVKGERRRISFREVDVEQIGYVYEGLLGYSCAEVTDDIILGLAGKEGLEPEVPLRVLNNLYEDSGGDSSKFGAALKSWVEENQPSLKNRTKTASAFAKLTDQKLATDDRAELVRLLSPVAAGNNELLEHLVGWGNLIRRDLRNIPLVFPVGGLVVIETPSRKNAGAHYTPRSLTEEVVRHALQPLVYQPGPLQSNDSDEWRLRPSTAILDLRVADIAAGSGAFLVAAARFLTERLLEAWKEEGIINEAVSDTAEEWRAHALREVICRCLYGADINPMAVEMCKLSLWLVSMDKTKPFSFVDDKIFCGNALLGLTSLDQLRYLHIDPQPSTMHEQMLVDIGAKIAAATQLRRELTSPVEERDPLRSSRAKARLLEQFCQATAELRLIGDGVIAAALPLGGKPGRRLDDAFKTLSWQIQQAYPADGSPGDSTALRDRVTSGLTPSVPTDYELWQPLHWVVEVPDVMVDHGGFDAVIGNPPFLRVSEQTAAMGDDVRDFVVERVAGGSRGMADFVAYFFRRAAQVSGERSTIGLIATNSIAQNHSSKVGLVPLVEAGWTIFEAVKSRPWPAVASFHFSLVALSRRRSETVRLEGRPVDAISPTLEELHEAGSPVQLQENLGRSFEGFKLTGKGFILGESDARRILGARERNSEVVRPYLITDDITTRPDESPSRWAIDFGAMSMDAARSYPEPMAHVEARVKPGRLTAKRKSDRERWWQYGESRPGLRSKISGLEAVVVIGVLAKWLSVSRQPAGVIYSNRLIVVPDDSYSVYGQLCSSVHENWTRAFSGRLEDRLVYNPTAAFRTYPFASGSSDIESTAKRYERTRSRVMMLRSVGLNGFGNLMNDSKCLDADIAKARLALTELDEAVIRAYGWGDIELTHDFVADQGVTRYTLGSGTWKELRRRLVRENHHRARSEGQDVPDQPSPIGQDTPFA